MASNIPERCRPFFGGIVHPQARSNAARSGAFSTCWKPGRRSGIAPMSPPPWTLFWPRSGLSPEPYRPTCPQSSARLMRARTLSTALWCSVMPSVQQIMARGARAKVWAISRMTAAGTCVSRSPRSSVQPATWSRKAAKPLVACSMNSRCSRPAARISCAIVLESAMSEPTSRPAQRSAHSAEVVRRGSIATSFAPRCTPFSR